MLIHARVRIIGVNPHILLTSKQVSEIRKDWRGPMPVWFLVVGRSESLWSVNLMPVRDGTFRLYLNGTIRKASRVAVGDLVSIEVRFDEEYRGGPLHPMPSRFAEELERNAGAMRGWKALSPSRQKEILRYFAGLKSEVARERNLSKALHVLSGGRARFMGRSWNEEDKR